MIQQVYQYIYEEEDQRVDRKVRKIEGLFEMNPLEFNELLVDTRLERKRREKEHKHLYRSYQQIYEEEMAKAKAIRERMQFIIEKYNIDLREGPSMQNQDRYRVLCNQDEQVFYGYKNRQFFEQEKIEEKKVKKAANLIKKIIDRVTMKEELNLLAKLIHRNFGPNSIQSLISSMSFIPVDWRRDLAIYSEEEIPEPINDGSASSLEPLDKL